MKKALLLLMCLLILPSALAAVEDIPVEVELDFRDQKNFTVEVEGGQSFDFDCQVLSESGSNYNDYDKEISAEVKYEGVKYETEIGVDWKDTHTFLIESELEDKEFDCNDVGSGNFNNFDEDFELLFTVNTPAAELDEDTIEDIVKKVINETESIDVLNIKIAEAEKDVVFFEEKWTTCEQESGGIKEELKDLRNENQDLSELSTQLSVKSSELRSCEERRASLQDTVRGLNTDIDELENKGGGAAGLLWFLVGVVGTYLYTKREDNQPPEQEDFDYEEGYEG